MMMDMPVRSRNGVMVNEASRKKQAIRPLQSCRARIGASPNVSNRNAVTRKRKIAMDTPLMMRGRKLDWIFN
jgi:hypothetical protein